MVVYEIFFFSIFQVNIRNKETVNQNNIAEKYYKIGNPNYVETFNDCIRMALIFADFQISKNMHSHVGDNIIYWR